MGNSKKRHNNKRSGGDGHLDLQEEKKPKEEEGLIQTRIKDALLKLQSHV